MFTWPANRNLVNILNNAAILYLSGMAAAIGFRMNLFNIGVEGQYRIGDVRRALPSPAQAGCPGWPQHRRPPSWSRWRRVRRGPASPGCCGSRAGSAR